MSNGERPLGIVSALPEEMGGLGLALDKGDVVEVGGYHFHHGRVDGHPVVLAEAGCGKVATAIVASLLADRFGCAGLVFSGVAESRTANERISLPGESAARHCERNWRPRRNARTVGTCRGGARTPGNANRV